MEGNAKMEIEKKIKLGLAVSKGFQFWPTVFSHWKKIYLIYCRSQQKE